MSKSFRRTVPAAAAVAAIALGGVASPAMARHGADDPVGHDRGVHHVHHRAHKAGDHHRKGHDHRKGDDRRRGRGTDDGPNHT
jgi:hypothetical protein